MKNPNTVNTRTEFRTVTKKHFVADARPDRLDPKIDLGVSGAKSFRVRKLRPSEALKIVRFLLAKVVREQGISTLTPTEQVLLHASVEKLQSFQRNIQWIQRNRDLLTGIATASWIFRMYSEGKEVPSFRIERVRQSDWFPNDFVYFGWWIAAKKESWLISINRLLAKAPRPKRFIGVGYRDHGTRREVSYDGSPLWQDVAVLGDFKKKLNPLLHDPSGLVFSGLGAAFGLN